MLFRKKDMKKKRLSLKRVTVMKVEMKINIEDGSLVKGQISSR